MGSVLGGTILTGSVKRGGKEKHKPTKGDNKKKRYEKILTNRSVVSGLGLENRKKNGGREEKKTEKGGKRG